MELINIYGIDCSRKEKKIIVTKLDNSVKKSAAIYSKSCVM